MDIPHFEMHPELHTHVEFEEFEEDIVHLDGRDSSAEGQTELEILQLKEKIKRQNRYLIETKYSWTRRNRLSLNVHPKLEDINLALRDLVLKANWTKVAVLYSTDQQGPTSLHLQHMLLKKNVDCFCKEDVFEQGKRHFKHLFLSCLRCSRTYSVTAMHNFRM